MNKKLIVTASILGMITILLGAFGAHGLKKIVSPEAVTSFETGVRYQMYHTFLLLFLAMTNLLTAKNKKVIAFLTIVGIILFSGSIYFLTFKSFYDFSVTPVAILTPIGGFFFIFAWLYMAISAIKHK